MTIAIQSQINTTSLGLTSSSGWITVGWLPDENWYADGAAAIRFELPEDLETIYSATLTINAASTGGGGKWCRTTVGIITGPQTLPTTYGGIMAATARASSCVLGGHTNIDVDEAVEGTKAVVHLDMTAAFAAAQSDGALSGGYVVILLRPHSSSGSNTGGVSHEIDGLGSPVPPTLTLIYEPWDPPLDPAEEPIENAQTRSQGDNPVATYITTATPTDGLTRSVGGPVAATVTLTALPPQPGQTRSAGDNPQAIAGLSAVIADAMTRSVGDTLEASSAGGWIDRPLFPTGLFPAGLIAQ